MDVRTAARRVERAARSSDALRWSVRLGLLGYAVVHLLVALVAVRLVVDVHAGQATGQGALAQLAGQGLGRVVLAAMAVGFGALLLWQLVAGAVGYRDRQGLPRLLMRVGAAARTVTYAYLAVAAGRLALVGGAAGRGSPASTSARVLSWPAGPWLLAAVGVGVAATGVGLAVFGWRDGFTDQLEREAWADDRRTAILVVGRVGYVAKGTALVVVGVLLAWVAVTGDAQRSGGLDEALRELLGDTLGTVAIVVVGAGLACFGLYLLARARHLARRTVTA